MPRPKASPSKTKPRFSSYAKVAARAAGWCCWIREANSFPPKSWPRFLREHQDRNPLPLVFAIGPADGFSDALRAKADFVLSIGKMTLAHELARVVLLEQVYRAFTVLKGHPYHLGH